MLEKASEEVRWLHKVNDMLLIEINKKNAMQIVMDAHFNQLTHACSQIWPFLTLGDSVITIEEAFSNDAEHS